MYVKVFPQGKDLKYQGSRSSSLKGMVNLKAYYYYSLTFKSRSKVKVIYFSMYVKVFPQGIDLKYQGSRSSSLKGMVNLKAYYYYLSTFKSRSKIIICFGILEKVCPLGMYKLNEPRHEISNNVVCATSKGSDQPAHRHSLIITFASRLNSGGTRYTYI